MDSILGLADEDARKCQNGKLVACPICGHEGIDYLLAAPDRFHLRKEMYSLVRCPSCRVVRQTTPPRPEEMSRHYTRDYHDAITAAGEGSATLRWRAQTKLISHFKSGGELLDIGCSSGGFLSTMRGPEWDLYGIEMEAATAEKARVNASATVYVGDALAAPYRPNSFDVITCFDVLEHVYDPRQFLTKVREWLKPGGILYTMMPNIESWEARLFGTHWFGLELPRHLFHFSPRSLRYLTTSLGFEEVVLRTPRVSYVERSMRYIGSDLIERLGFSATPQARPKPLSFPLKAVRKVIRLVALAPIAQLASLAGAGPSLEVVLRKNKS